VRRNAARGSGIPPGWTNLLWSAVAPGRPGEYDRGRGDELALDHRARAKAKMSATTATRISAACQARQAQRTLYLPGRS
jgi:hypothetical protein